MLSPVVHQRDKCGHTLHQARSMKREQFSESKKERALGKVRSKAGQKIILQRVGNISLGSLEE